MDSGENVRQLVLSQNAPSLTQEISHYARNRIPASNIISSQAQRSVETKKQYYTDPFLTVHRVNSDIEIINATIGVRDLLKQPGYHFTLTLDHYFRLFFPAATPSHGYE